MKLNSYVSSLSEKYDNSWQTKKKVSSDFIPISTGKTFLYSTNNELDTSTLNHTAGTGFSYSYTDN
jgi:hypothetical protein